jgi:hypothetical protein
MRCVPLFLLMAAVAAPATAQDASKPPPAVKQEIVVTAAREEQPRDHTAPARRSTAKQRSAVSYRFLRGSKRVGTRESADTNG